MIENLPTLNAFLNTIAAGLLVRGFVAIRNGQVEEHRQAMVMATAVSGLFLVSYLTYHYQHGSTPFPGTGWSRTLYFSILIPHTILAAVQVPLIVATITFAVRGNLPRHRRFAKITLPMWLFVSTTGVIIYLMLYHLFPGD